MIFITACKSKIAPYNPFMILLGYSYYKIKTKNGVILNFISKSRYRTTSGVYVFDARRNDNYTFVEIEE